MDSVPDSVPVLAVDVRSAMVTQQSSVFHYPQGNVTQAIDRRGLSADTLHSCGSVTPYEATLHNRLRSNRELLTYRGVRQAGAGSLEKARHLCTLQPNRIGR